MLDSLVFIADMHLGRHTPELNQLFIQKLDEWRGQVAALYLLGDLFEVWVGDDAIDTVTATLMAKMAAFSAQTPLYVMRGNRDFLLGERFARQSGAILLTDPHIIHFDGQVYILSHGDALCSLDLRYQAFRQKVQNPAWQKKVLAYPLWLRRLIAGVIRWLSSRRKKRYFDAKIMDVTEEAIEALQHQIQHDYPDLPSLPYPLIHGHTHRPAIHQHLLAGQKFWRYVIPDWRMATGGGALIVRQGCEPKIEMFDLNGVIMTD